MMSIGNKEEVGAQGQRLDEPNIGVPIKKRPFQLTNPRSLESSVPYLDKFALAQKHFTPKSPLDFPLSGFDPGNPSPDLNKPAGVAMNPLHDFNTVDMDRNYCTLKPSSTSGIRMEMLQVGNTPKLHPSISDNLRNKEKLNQCSTDLSLTGPSTVSSKPCFKPSYNLSYDMESRSVFDLNVPTSETWDSSTDGFPFSNNNFAHTQPVEALAKQGNISGMIPPGMGSGVIPNGVVSGLVPKGAGNNLMLEKSYEKCNVNEVTLDLQLKLPPRPELRMKNMERVCSSDLSLSLSGKDLNTSPEPVNVKPRVVENSQKTINKDNTDPIVKPVPQNQVIVKQESREIILPEKVVQASGLKDQSLASGGSVVKKEPMDTTSQAHHSGKLDKPPSSGSDLRLDKQAETTETNNLTKGIDLNFATPLPDVSNVDKTANPVSAKSVVSDRIVQHTISQSDAHHNHENVDDRKLSSHKPSLASTSSPLVGTEDIKPVIVPSASPTVDNNKKMASDGLSQGSADMDCSEGNTLAKSASTCKTVKNTTNETNALSSSSVTKIPKQEVGSSSEFESVKIREDQRGENVKSSDVKENQIQISIPMEASFAQKNENNIPSSSTKVDDLPNKSIEGVSLDMDTAGGSKSRSPSTSMSRRDKEGDQSSERENGTSSRQTEENNISHRRFKRTDLSPNREYFERKKSRMSSWNEGSNIHLNRGQRWEGQRYPQFDGDRFENEDNANQRAGFAMANRKRQTNRFNSRFGHSNYKGFRFTRTHSNPDMNFDEGNDGRNSRPHPHFQNRSRFADVSPRGMDELDSPVFEHPNNNHYKRVDHAIHDRSSSPGPRRGLHQWIPSGEMIGGHSDLLTRADTRDRSPGRRPFFKKDSFNRRHASPPYNRVHSFGRGRGRGRGRGMHWNNGRQRYDGGAPHGPVADVQDMEPYGEIHCQGGEMMPFHARYTDNDGAFLDGARPHDRVRNRPREVGNPEEYRFNNRGPRGWRDGNPNNNGDKLKRRRY